MTSLDIFESISVLGDVTLGVHDGLHAAGHGVGEGGEELLLPAENLPGARDLLGEIVQVCGGLPSGNDLLELSLGRLYFVEQNAKMNAAMYKTVLQRHLKASMRMTGTEVFMQDGFYCNELR